MDKKRSFIIF